MLRNLLKQALEAEQSTLPVNNLLALLLLESPGKGFDPSTGKLLIQFEPHVFAREAKLPRDASVWSTNRIDTQTPEWKAFNDAFKINPTAAMRATSVGLPQIMGFNHLACGYATVGDMWDDFKKGELQQLRAFVRFIHANKRLVTAVTNKDWHTVASIYNGKNYKVLALQNKTTPYDVKLSKTYEKLTNNKG